METDNAIYIKSLIGKRVRIETVDNKKHEGIVYVIDPIYKTVALVDEENSSLELVLHHAITSFTVTSEAVVRDFLQNPSERFQQEDILKRRNLLAKWLRHMHIDVKEEDENLRVEDHLIIAAPYTRNDCICNNRIVLERIRNIIDLIPADFE